MAKTKIHQVVLKMAEYQGLPGVTIFDAEDTDKVPDNLWLPNEAWKKFGCPEEVTVHVFPGDVSHHFPIPNG